MMRTMTEKVVGRRYVRPSREEAATFTNIQVTTNMPTRKSFADLCFLVSLSNHAVAIDSYLKQEM